MNQQHQQQRHQQRQQAQHLLLHPTAFRVRQQPQNFYYCDNGDEDSGDVIRPHQVQVQQQQQQQQQPTTIISRTPSTASSASSAVPPAIYNSFTNNSTTTNHHQRRGSSRIRRTRPPSLVLDASSSGGGGGGGGGSSSSTGGPGGNNTSHCNRIRRQQQSQQHSQQPSPLFNLFPGSIRQQPGAGRDSWQTPTMASSSATTAAQYQNNDGGSSSSWFSSSSTPTITTTGYRATNTTNAAAAAAADRAAAPPPRHDATIIRRHPILPPGSSSDGPELGPGPELMHHHETTTAADVAKESPQAGYLLKLGSNVREFKRRFFVLQPRTHLYYFLSPNDVEPRGCLDLERTSIEELGQLPDGRFRFAIKWNKNNSNTNDNHDDNHDDDHKVILEARDIGTGRQWMDCLEKQRLGYCQTELEKSQHRNVALKQRISDLETVVENFRLVEKDRDLAIEESQKWKNEFVALDNSLQQLTQTLIKQQPRQSPAATEAEDNKSQDDGKAVLQEEDDDGAVLDDAGTAAGLSEPERKKETSSNPSVARSESSLLDNEDIGDNISEAYTTLDPMKVPGAHFSSLYNSCQQLQQNWFLASEEASQAVEDLTESQTKLATHEKRMGKAEKHLCKLWEENCELRKSLKQKKREKRVLVKEVKNLQQQQQQQATNAAAAAAAAAAVTEEEEEDHGEDDDEKLLQELEEHVMSSIKLHEKLLVVGGGGGVSAISGPSANPKAATTITATTTGNSNTNNNSGGASSSEAKDGDKPRTDTPDTEDSSTRHSEAAGSKGDLATTATNGKPINMASLFDDVSDDEDEEESEVDEGCSDAIGGTTRRDNTGDGTGATTKATKTTSVAPLPSISSMDVETSDTEEVVAANKAHHRRGVGGGVSNSDDYSRAVGSGNVSSDRRRIVFSPMPPNTASSVATKGASFSSQHNRNDSYSSATTGTPYDELRPNPLLQLDEDDSQYQEYQKSSTPAAPVVNVATTKLMCPLADVVVSGTAADSKSGGLNKEACLGPLRQQEGQGRNHHHGVYHLTFYSRKIGIQFQKVPPPPVRAKGLLTDAMTADLATTSTSADGVGGRGNHGDMTTTTAELQRIAEISTWVAGKNVDTKNSSNGKGDNAICPVAAPVDAVLVCGFVGFDDDRHQERPKLGARLVAFDGVSIEVGKWTFDSVRKAIKARDRPLTLSFRNDYLTTEQRSILTKAIQDVGLPHPASLVQPSSSSVSTSSISNNAASASRPNSRHQRFASHDDGGGGPLSIHSAITHESDHFVSGGGGGISSSTPMFNKHYADEDDLTSCLSIASSSIDGRMATKSIPQSFSGVRSITSRSGGNSNNFRSFSEAGGSSVTATSSVLSAVAPLVSNLLYRDKSPSEPFTPDYMRREPESVEDTPQHQDFESELL